MKRQCGDCQLCCKLVPVPSIGKTAGQRCKNQRFRKGCAVYHTAKMPMGCSTWNCRWLVNDDTADLVRPDRSHYVIDINPDYHTLTDKFTGETSNVPVVQIWLDPRHPNAHRDPALRAYLSRRGDEGIAGMIRPDIERFIILWPPQMTGDRQWHEVTNWQREKEHSWDDVTRVLGEIQQKRDESGDHQRHDLGRNSSRWRRWYRRWVPEGRFKTGTRH